MLTTALLQAATPAPGSFDITLAVYCAGAVGTLVILVRLLRGSSSDAEFDTDLDNGEPAASESEEAEIHAMSIRAK